MWERFSYYGMRAILVLFLAAPESSGGLGLAPHLAAAVFGVYGALVNLLAVPGGWLADRVWGAQRAVVAGGSVIAMGHCVLALPVGPAATYVGLLLVATGTGMLKPSISNMVGGLYDPLDRRGTQEGPARRDAGFTLFYMGINTGAFAAPLVTGYLGERVGWHTGFGVAAVGMLIGVLVALRGRHRLPEASRHPVRRLGPGEVRRATGIGTAALSSVAVVALVTAALGVPIVDGFVLALSLVTIAVPVVCFVVMFRAPGLDPVERDRLRAYVWIFVAASAFWMIAEQGGSVVSLFARDRVARDLFGWEFPTSWFQSLGPAYAIFLALMFAALWQRLGRAQPSTTAKFSLGLLGLGTATLLLSAAAAAAGEEGQISPLWLLVAFLVQIMAEMCLSPTGLSATTRLAPARLANQMMSLWWLSVATGSALSAQVVQLAGILSYSVYFAVLGAVAVGGAGAMALARRRLGALMHDSG